jgi:hypothetical protein
MRALEGMLTAIATPVALALRVPSLEPPSIRPRPSFSEELC